MRHILSIIFALVVLSTPISHSCASDKPLLFMNTALLITEIQQATDSIQIATYSAYLKDLWSSHDPIIEALEKAQRRGVDVSIQWNGFHINSNQNQAMLKKQSTEAKWCQYKHFTCSFPSQTNAYYHRKFMIIDNHVAFIMTGNFPWKVCSSLHPSKQSCLINYSWRITSPQMINSLNSIFQDDRIPSALKHIQPKSNLPNNLIVSPNDDHYAMFIQNTQSSLNVMQPFLNTWIPFTITNPLKDRLKKGISVRILTNQLPGPKKISNELLKLQKKYPTLLQIRLSKPSVFIHAKVMIRDQSSVIAGSINWSDWSLHHNREIDLIDDTPSNIKFALKQFNTLWQQADRITVD